MSERVYPLVPRFDRRLGYEVWVETHPDACQRGHDWTQPRTVLPRWRACGEHRGHREWVCATCGDVFTDPPIDETCGRTLGPRF